VKFAGRAGDKYSSTYAALTVFHTFYDPGRLAAFGAVRALRGVHDLLAVGCLGDLCHVLLITPKIVMDVFYAIPVLPFAHACGNRDASLRLESRPIRNRNVKPDEALQILISDSPVEAALHPEEALPQRRVN
jgi:hypothetical protein